MKILKFGGSSVGSQGAIEKVLAIIGQRTDGDEIAVVVSALKDVTNQLQAAADEAAIGRKHTKSISSSLKSGILLLLKISYLSTGKVKHWPA
jgi:aspartokinase/homoserine dehydrogenase 1